MNVTPTALDSFAAILLLIIGVVSGFTLLGTGILMAIGAVFSNRPLVTSWPADQEHSFAPYERRSASAGATAWVLSIAGAVLVTFLAAGIYFGVAPERHEFGKDMNMSNLTKRTGPATAAPAAKAAAPAAPAEAKPDSAAPAEAPAKAGTPAAPAEAPKP